MGGTFRCDVAGTLDRLFVILLEQDGVDQANNGALVRKDADYIGASLDFG
jgi:hypothetical protein